MPIPNITNDKGVLIKVHAMGICGSDMHAYHGKLATVSYPRVIGHEVVGEVVETGTAVTKVRSGEHVVMDPVVSCGQCHACKSGRNNVCKDVKCMGVAAEGGCAEYIILQESNVHAIPADIPWRDAVLMEPYTIGAQITARGDVSAGDHVLIMGAGPIGLVALQAAKRRGAKVIVTDVVKQRLKLACEMDADLVVNPQEQDLAQAVSEFTKGYGLDVAVDAVGVPALFEQAVELTAPGARVVIVGFNPTPAQIAELPITRKELDIRGSRMHAGKFPEVISWFANREVKTAPLVSHAFPFEHIHEAFTLLETDPESTCKVIITF
jgi:L-gulonate 5-dehydrogenase